MWLQLKREAGKSSKFGRLCRDNPSVLCLDQITVGSGVTISFEVHSRSKVKTFHGAVLRLGREDERPKVLLAGFPMLTRRMHKAYTATSRRPTASASVLPRSKISLFTAQAWIHFFDEERC